MPRNAIWTDIEATLREELARGTWPPGEKLPAKSALATRFGVNRHTVRRALAALGEAGLTHSRRGAGVFVMAKPTVYPIGRRVRFNQNLEAAGRTASRETLRLETIPAAAREAEALGIKTGDPVHILEGVASADGAPITLFRSWFPAERLPGLKAGLEETSSVTAALAREGVADYTRASTEITAKRAGPVQARHLKLSEGAPLIRAISVNIDSEGIPVEYGRTWFAGERVTLVMKPGDQP